MAHSIILAPTVRSKAIVQLFHQLGIKIESAIILPGSEPSFHSDSNLELELYKLKKKFTFNLAEPLTETLSKSDIPFTVAPTNDVNHEKFRRFLSEYKQSSFIYSGVAGCILKEQLLKECCKSFIHSHGGVVPRFSGSTAFYYSILERGTFGATVFRVDEGLDTGEVLYQIEAFPYSAIDIDYIQDPVIRAEALALFCMRGPKDITMTTLSNRSEKRVTYHVIHPILKL